jgi:hypothetical protein
MADDGAFMTVWEDNSCSVGLDRAVGRAFDPSGTAAGPEFAVDTSPPPSEYGLYGLSSYPVVAADEAGHFIVAWQRETYSSWWEGSERHHIRVGRFDGSGNALGPGSPANTSWRNVPRRPAVAAREPGTFIVAWDVAFDDLSSLGAFARRPDVLFVDAFETGDLHSWSGRSTDGGDLAPSHAARMGASPTVIDGLRGYGLQATVDDRAGIFVQDDTPMGEARYRARFYLDPNGFDPGESAGHFRQPVFLGFQASPLKRLLFIVLRRRGGEYSIAARVRRDDNTQAMTPFVPIADGPNAIEIDWQRASAPGANDGRLEMWVDGASVATLTGLDNDERGIDFVRLGAMSVRAGASGTLYFDEFVSRRLGDIGP